MPIKILLTNDDSHDSPLFHYAIDALSQLGELEIAVPATEQSWQGKAMTRFGNLYADRIEIHGSAAWSISGTPADCVNLAIYNLLDNKPDVVVSGTNIGKNTGLSFMFSSGTVGACLEANIAGIPALALSQELKPEQFFQWGEQRQFDNDISSKLRNISSRFIPLVWNELGIATLEQAVTWNVNFPLSDIDEPEITKTRLGHTFYDGCFKQRGDQFFHDLRTVDVDPSSDSDETVVQSGRISATLLNIKDFGQAIPG
ncbi:MAG: 5'/3'-nucleotidase SurE [Gammaproteobacteria bacterium]